LIVDLTEVGYINSVGEQLLKGLASAGALFVAGSVYAIAAYDRLRLSPMQRISERRKRRNRNNEESPSNRHSHPVEAI
jgi:hypothetical protein